MIASASRGHFNDLEIQRGMPAALQTKYFMRLEDGWKIRDEIRAMVSFRLLNLLQPFSFPAPFDIVFCRNVAIYFTEQNRVRLFQNIQKCMDRDGALVIGSTESLTGLCPSLESRRYLRTVYYGFSSVQ